MLSPAIPIPVFFFASFLFAVVVVGGGGGGNSGVSVKIVRARIEERIEALDCALEERVPPPVIGGRWRCGVVAAAAEGRVGKPRKEQRGRGGRVVWSFEIRVGGDFGVWEGKVVRWWYWSHKLILIIQRQRRNLYQDTVSWVLFLSVCVWFLWVFSGCDERKWKPGSVVTQIRQLMWEWERKRQRAEFDYFDG